MNKKAIGAIFAWIFILIAGALIITVFTVIASGQGESAQNRLHLQALQNVNTILATQQTTGDVTTNITIPRNELRIVCRVFVQEDNDKLGVLNQLEIGGFSQNLDTQLVVGRDMETDDLSLFSKRWDAPFTVGNILYVSSPDEQLYYTTGIFALKEAFIDLIPENIQPQEGTANDIQASRWENVRVVVLGNTDPPSPGDYENKIEGMQEDVVYAYVYTEDDFASGTVTFYGLTDIGTVEKGEPYHFVGAEMMLAYIWQGDAESASCLQNKLAQRLKAQTDLQLARMRALHEQYPEAGDCKGRYFETPITNIRDALELKKDTYPEKPLYDFSNLKEAVDSLEQHNRFILRGDGCATIY